GADRIDPLDVRGRAERRDGQRLRLTAGEEPGAVGPRDQSDLNRDRPDVGEAAAVDPDPLVEDDPPDGLLLDQAEEVLADARLASSGLEERVRVATLALSANGIADRLAEGRDPAGPVVCEPEQQIGRRLGVARAPMRLRQLDPEEPGQVGQLVRLGARVALASDDERVEVLARLEPEPVALRLLDEAEVEADVVADDRRVADEGEQLVGRLLRAR